MLEAVSRQWKRESGGEPAQLEEKGKKLFHLFASPYDQAQGDGPHSQGQGRASAAD